MKVTIYIKDLLQVYLNQPNLSAYLCITIRDGIIKNRTARIDDCSNKLHDMLCKYFQLTAHHYESQSIGGWFLRFMENDDYSVTGKYLVLTDGSKMEISHNCNMRNVRIKMLEYILEKNPEEVFAFEY